MIDRCVELDKQENPKAKIWRYMDFTKFVSLLEKQKLFFVNLSKLEDKYEGRIPEKRLAALISSTRNLANHKHITPWGKKSFNAAADYFEGTHGLINDMRDILYVCSWHVNEFESHAMWKLYLNSNEGIAIQTTYEKLLESFSGNEVITFGYIKYIDYESSEPLSYGSPEPHPFLRFSFTKRPYFEYERELRVAYFPLNQDKNKLTLNDVKKFLNNNSTDMGLYIQTDINKLIDNVYVSPCAPIWFSDLVQSVIKKYDFKFNVIKSSL